MIDFLRKSNLRKKLLVFDKAAYLLVIVLLGVFRPDALMMAVYLLLYPYLFLTARKPAFYHLFVASGIALIWVSISNDLYGYNTGMMRVFGLNSFPLFAWASGLFATYLIYSHWEHKFGFTNPVKKLVLFTAFYWPILIVLESAGYHLFDIQNLATSSYAGLPLCDCIHAPLWMQLSYFGLGPLYLVICELLGLENPHKVLKSR